MKTLTAIIKKPGQEPYVAQIEDTLEAYQAVVEGWIERVPGDATGLPYGVDIYANEESKIRGMTPNFWIFGNQDQIWGNALFLGADESTGENRSLTEAERLAVLGWLEETGRVVL